MRVDEILEAGAGRQPDKTALVCGPHRWSYQQMEERANRLAHALLEMGLAPGDRVGIGLENCVETIVAIFGVLKAGGVFFVINPQGDAGRLAHALEDCDARVLIGRRPTIAAIRDSAQSFAALMTIPVPFEGGLASGGGSAAPPPKRHGDTDLAALVYTSGSTGAPKGVMLTHRNMTAAAEAIRTYLENTADDVILNVMPLAFTYGLGQVTTAFRSGGTLVLERSFMYPRAVIDTMVRERVTGFPLVPTIATLLLKQDLETHRFPHLRYITTAAAAMPVSRIQQLRRAFPGVRLFSMYGQTECQRISYLPSDQIEMRPDSVGIAIPGTSVCVVDGDGDRVAPGVVGQLVVRGPHIMRGYWNQPDATARALRPGPEPGESVLYTGDLFTMDEGGWLYFVGRTDDVIKTRGEKVAPRHIEEVISRMPGVAEVAVCGMPDDVLGEAIAAMITVAEHAVLDADDVRGYCMRNLPSFMVPAMVEFRKTLPTTSTGKVDRREVRAIAATWVAA